MVECVVDVGFPGEKSKIYHFYLFLYLFLFFLFHCRGRHQDVRVFEPLEHIFEHTLRNVASNHADQNSITEKRFP